MGHQVYGALVYVVKILGFQSGVRGSIPRCVANIIDGLIPVLYSERLKREGALFLSSTAVVALDC